MLLKMEEVMSSGMRVVPSSWDTGSCFICQELCPPTFSMMEMNGSPETPERSPVLDRTEILVQSDFMLPSDLGTLTANLVLSPWLVMAVSESSTRLTLNMLKSRELWKFSRVEGMHLLHIGNLLSLLHPGVILAWVHRTYTMVFETKKTGKVLCAFHDGEQ